MPQVIITSDDDSMDSRSCLSLSSDDSSRVGVGSDTSSAKIDVFNDMYNV